jgi:hypothetical protein
MPLIECYNCKNMVSEKVNECPQCGFEYPLGDSIVNCVVCIKEIHELSLDCYSCGTNDPHGRKKARKERNPILYYMEIPIFLAVGVPLATYIGEQFGSFWAMLSFFIWMFAFMFYRNS